MTDTPATSGDLKLRAQRLLEKYPNELAKAVYVADKIEFTMTPGDLPKLRKVREDCNPMLAPRSKPLHLGVASLSKPKASHKAALRNQDVEYVIDVRAERWALLTEAGKDGTLFDLLYSIEVTEKPDGDLKYGIFRAGAAFHEESLAKFGAWADDIVDPRGEALLPPSTVEQLAGQRLANRPDALVVGSAGEK